MALEINLGENGGLFRFKTHGEITEWLDEEYGFWSELQKAFSLSSHTMPLSEFFLSMITRFRDDLNRKDISNEDYKNLFEENKNVLIKNNYLCSKTQEARFIKKLLREENVWITLGALFSIMPEEFKDENNISQMWNSLMQRRSGFRQFLLGIARMAVFQSKTSKKGKSITDSVEESMAEIYERFNELLEKGAGELDQVEGHKDKVENEWQTFREQSNEGWQTFTNTSSEEWNNRKQEISDEWGKIKDKYETQISLQAPIKYWEDKAKSHVKRRTAYLSGFLSTISLVVGLTFFAAVFGNSNFGDWEDLLTPGKIGIFALDAALLTFARMFYKFGMSNEHLANDAEERVTMIKAYLGLREKGNIKNEDSEIVLHRIFTPATDGILKGDAGAATFADSLLRFFNPKK